MHWLGWWLQLHLQPWIWGRWGFLHQWVVVSTPWFLQLVGRHSLCPHPTRKRAQWQDIISVQTPPSHKEKGPVIRHSFCPDPTFSQGKGLVTSEPYWLCLVRHLDSGTITSLWHKQFHWPVSKLVWCVIPRPHPYTGKKQSGEPTQITWASI